MLVNRHLSGEKLGPNRIEGAKIEAFTCAQRVPEEDMSGMWGVSTSEYSGKTFWGVGPLITLLLLYGGGYRRILGGRGGHGVKFGSRDFGCCL